MNTVPLINAFKEPPRKRLEALKPLKMLVAVV
jgi:hypothetical protein